jgi:threonine/homoserine/homoserine lactone efflux protein
MVVIRSTLTRGRRSGIACSVGHGLGFGLYALAAISGLVVLMREAPLAFTAAQFLGACLLLYLAYKTATSAPVAIAMSDEPSAIRNAFIEGFAIAILNPKIALFFLAVFSTVLNTDMQAQTQVLIVLTGWLIDTGWYTLVAVVLTIPAALPFLTNNQRYINPLTAMLFVALAGYTFYRLLM